jgi:hypothetical protein
MKPSIPNYELSVPDTPARRPEGWRELACRRSGGTSVRLFWRPRENDVLVFVKDELTGEDFILEPPKHAALDAFYHPYAQRR